MKELEQNLLKNIEKEIPRGKKSASLEEAFLKALELEDKKEEETDEITSNAWI